MTYKLDIKDVLANIDAKQFGWYDSLTPEEQDGFNPFVVMQYLNGGGSYNLEMTNAIINKDFAVKSKNKSLFWRLCCVIGTGTKQRHQFTKPPKSGRKSGSLISRLMMDHESENLTEQESLMILVKNYPTYDTNYWVMMAEGFDWTTSDVSKLKEELNTVFNVV